MVCRQHVWMDSFTRYLCWHLYGRMEYWCSDQYTELYPGNIWSTQGTKPFSCTRKHYHHLIILCNHATICSLVRGGDNEEKYTWMACIESIIWMSTILHISISIWWILTMIKTRQAKKGRIVGEWYLQEFGYVHMAKIACIISTIYKIKILI